MLLQPRSSQYLCTWVFGCMQSMQSVIFSTQTVAGVLAYGVALIDSDGNGESDELDTKAHAQSNSNVNNTGDTK